MKWRYTYFHSRDRWFAPKILRIRPHHPVPSRLVFVLAQNRDEYITSFHRLYLLSFLLTYLLTWLLHSTIHSFIHPNLSYLVRLVLYSPTKILARIKITQMLIEYPACIARYLCKWHGGFESSRWSEVSTHSWTLSLVMVRAGIFYYLLIE